MMKNNKWMLVLCAFILVILICFVGWYVQNRTKWNAEELQCTVTTDPDITESLQIEDEDTTATSDTSTVEIIRPDIMIYTGPGYDYSDTGTLLEIGSYTITDEETDREGILWGRLAVGDGWIDLHKAAEAPPHIPLTMELDYGDKLAGVEYIEHTVTESEYTQRLLFRAYEPLTDIRFSMMDVTAGGLISGEPLYTLNALGDEEALIIGVVFFGDLTTYGLSFIDAAGTEHHYMLYTSGRNGSIVMQAYTPTGN